MFARLFYVALISGILAGLVVTGAQAVRAWPLILKAEVYERQTGVAKPTYAEAAVWPPEDGAARMLFTASANMLAGIGFALLLAAAYALRGNVDWRRGLIWGLAGFATFVLAPALGLPPELPGGESAPLVARQIWWVGTALATGGGLALIAFVSQRLWKVAGALLILLPHAIGAPRHGEHTALLPLDLSISFIVTSLLGNLLFWLALGGFTAVAFNRLVRPRLAVGA